ncbi:MAG: hypothetical protein R2912_04275 [Eubacteriales bacterium]
MQQGEHDELYSLSLDAEDQLIAGAAPACIRLYGEIPLPAAGSACTRHGKRRARMSSSTHPSAR